MYICRIERGDRVPSLQVLRELARRVGVDENYLATGSAGADDDRALEADVALRLDQLEVAEHLYTQLLEAATPTGSSAARALGGLGQIDLHAGRVDEAIERLEEARSCSATDRRAPRRSSTRSRGRTRMRGEYESAIGAARARARARDRAAATSQAETRITRPPGRCR